jgi:hypothetical protein
MAYNLQRDLASRGRRLKNLGIPTLPAIWLRPKRVVPGSIGTTTSKIGGIIAWPTSVPWPICEIPHEHIGAPIERNSDSYVVVSQFQNADFPEIKFPDGADVVQILWCPHPHRHPSIQYGGIGPVPRVFWHSLAGLADGPNPIPRNPVDWLVPVECSFNPLRLDDAPGWGELTDQQRRRLSGNNEGYHERLGTIPGTKLRGWMDWTSHSIPVCTCGRTMELLFTIVDIDVDVASGRWSQRYGERPEGQHGAGPVGISLDHAMYIFYCETCLERPTQYLIENG